MTWDRIGPGLRDAPRSIAVAAISPDTVVVGGGLDDGIWRTDDSGESWTHWADQAPPGIIDVIVMAPIDTRVLYALNRSSRRAEDGLWRSHDGGASWLQVQAGTAFRLLAIDPRDMGGSAVVVASKDGIAYSCDDGMAFTSLGRPPGDRWSVRSMVVHDGTVLIGTDDGIWQVPLPPARP